MNIDNLTVLVLATTFPRWAGDRMPQFIHELAKSSQDDDIRVIVLAPHYPGAERRETMSGVTVYRFPYFVPFRYQQLAFQGKGGIIPSVKTSKLAAIQVPLFILSMLFHTLWIVRKEKVDVINSHWLIPNGVLGAFVTSILRKPHVLTLHARGVLTMQRIPMGKHIVSYVRNRSNAILPVSTHIRDAFLNAEDGRMPIDGEFQVQPMGAHVSEYDLSSRNELRAERGIDGDVRGLFVGRLVDKKGIDYLLDAISELDSEVSGFELSIVGSGPLEDQLQEYANDLDLDGSVTFAGWVSEKELHDQYVMADFVVVPSIETDSEDTEGMPTVIAEAFASGNPVIGTDVGGIPDVVKNGKNGYVIPQKDSSAIAEKMRLLIQDAKLRDELADSAIETGKALDWEQCGETYKEVFRRVADPELPQVSQFETSSGVSDQ